MLALVFMMGTPVSAARGNKENATRKEDRDYKIQQQMQHNIDAAKAAEDWKKAHPDAKPDEVKKQDQIITTSRAQNDSFVDQKPDNPKIQLLGAQTSFDAQDPQKTLQRAGNAEKLSAGDDKPLAAQAAYLTGRVHESEGDVKAALDDFKRAHDYDPTNNDVNVALKLLEGHNLGAVTIKATKDPFSAHANGADSRLAGTSNAPTSQAASGNAVGGKNAPELDRLFKDAAAKLDLDPKSAEEMANEILSKNPSSANGYFLRGLSREKQAQFAQAVEDFTKAIALGLRDALVYAARSAAYEAQRQFAQAEADGLQAAHLDSRNGIRFLNLGRIQAEEGKKAEAAASLDQAQTLDPSLAAAATSIERQYVIGTPAPGDSGHHFGWQLRSAAVALLFIAGAIALWRVRSAPPSLASLRGDASHQATSIDDTPTLDRAPTAGDRIGKFELRSRVGSGGMGEVWEAWDHVLNRRVALKRILVARTLDEEARQLFIAEARTAAQVSHPNKPEVYDLYQGEPSRALWLAQEFIAGGSVADALDSGPLPLDQCIEIAKGAAAVLDAFHALRIIHRDLKPSNILLDGKVPKVADFGIARAIQHPEGTVTLQMAGTPAYMAPEQYDGQVSPQTDRYALAVTLYQCLTGTLPFSANDVESKRQGRFVRASTRRPGLPAAVDGFFEQAFNPRSDARFGSGLLLAQAFQAALGYGGSVGANGPQERPTTPV